VLPSVETVPIHWRQLIILSEDCIHKALKKSLRGADDLPLINPRVRSRFFCNRKTDTYGRPIRLELSDCAGRIGRQAEGESRLPGP
jgi:hypothetical protein